MLGIENFRRGIADVAKALTLMLIDPLLSTISDRCSSCVPIVSP
jgi:hypothetical protein